MHAADDMRLVHNKDRRAVPVDLDRRGEPARGEAARDGSLLEAVQLQWLRVAQQVQVRVVCDCGCVTARLSALQPLHVSACNARAPAACSEDTHTHTRMHARKCTQTHTHTHDRMHT